jgi:hypothetical protein
MSGSTAHNLNCPALPKPTEGTDQVTIELLDERQPAAAEPVAVKGSQSSKLGLASPFEPALVLSGSSFALEHVLLRLLHDFCTLELLKQHWSQSQREGKRHLRRELLQNLQEGKVSLANGLKQPLLSMGPAARKPAVRQVGVQHKGKRLYLLVHRA